MPELPDIVVYLERLRPRIEGERLERIRLLSHFLLRSVDPPLEAVEGKRVRGLRRLGKRIVVCLEDELFLVLHPGPRISRFRNVKEESMSLTIPEAGSAPRRAPRTILHLDMDAFFAAVEVLDNPSLAGKPVIVGGTPEGRGVVGTASYEARRYGVHSAMPAAQAVKLCPRGIFLPPRMDRYAAVSRLVFSTLKEFSPSVEPLSIDEAFLDLTGTERLLGPAETAARAIKARVREVTGGLTASVGLAPNKFLAKVASDLKKPDGLVVVPPGGGEEFLAPLPVEKLWGVGPRTAEALHTLGLRRIGDLQGYPEEALCLNLGQETGRHLWLLARGIDERPVDPGGEARSVSSEVTFARFLPPDGLVEIDRTILSLSEEVAGRLREDGLWASRVVLKVRDERFSTRTRSRTLPDPTQFAEDLFECARNLFRERVDLGGLRVRLLGVAASSLAPLEAVQLDLFETARRRRAASVAEAMDRIRGKMGKEAVLRASLLDPRAGGSAPGAGRER